MSRVGKKPIPIPSGVTVNVEAGAVEVKGPKGTLRQAVPPGIVFELGDGRLTAQPERVDDRSLGKFHGLARSLVANAVHGVLEGFKKELDIVGIGYRAELAGQQVVFALGYSHPINFDIPKGDRGRGREANPPDGDGRRPTTRRPGRRRHPRAQEARSVQAKGHPLYGRSAEEEGREDRGVAMKVKTTKDRRTRVRLRQRQRIQGTAARPRLAVNRSLAHISAQVIDDLDGRTLVAASSAEPAVKAQFTNGARGGNKAGATIVGKIVAERLLTTGVEHVVFDRGGFLYHGRVRCVAEAAREAGLKF